MKFNPLELVADWHEKFYFKMPKTPTITGDVGRLRVATLWEEKMELEEAYANKDRVEMLDAFCDCQYFLSGSVLAFGVTKLFNAYGKSNPITFKPPHSVDDLLARIALYGIKIKELSMAIAQGEVHIIASRLKDMQWILEGMIASAEMTENFQAAFIAVHENNLLKTWDGLEARKWQEAQVSPSDSWIKLTFEKCKWKPGYCIAKNAMGKVIKPPNHPKVELSQFVTQLPA